MTDSRTCKVCGIAKPLDGGFYKRKTGAVTTHVCKACTCEQQKQRAAANPEKKRAYAKAYREANPEKVSAGKRKAYYGITQEEVERFRLLQGDRCFSCQGQLPANFHVDHDHSCCPGNKACGRCNRGLKCSNCNTALGLLKDSSQVLIRSAYYLATSRKGVPTGTGWF